MKTVLTFDFCQPFACHHLWEWVQSAYLFVSPLEFNQGFPLPNEKG
jgi:hypothetical protein